jgi:hypothetical protein
VNRSLSLLCAFASLRLCVLSLLLPSPALCRADSSAAANKPTVIVVVGAPGEEEYGKNFQQWGNLWVQAGQKGGANLVTIGLDPTDSAPQRTNSPAQPADRVGQTILSADVGPQATDSPAGPTDLDRLAQALAAQPVESPDELWIVLLGHGTYDAGEAKFNLRGPDLSATNLAVMLKPFKRPLAVINCASASAPFINALSAPGRVIITATRSGSEQNYARFGQYFSETIADPAADLDKDGQTSLLEAFLIASRRVAEFYKTAGRLVTEHALLDDNGDALGTPADWFHGARAVKRAKNGAGLDGLRANQFCLVRSDAERNLPAAIRARRDELELTLVKLRDSKASYSEDDYYQRLEPILVEMAKLSDK